MCSSDLVKLPSFTALKASATEFSLAGGEDIFNVSGHDIDIQVNWSSGWQGVAGKIPVVDFSTSFGADGLEIPTGADPVVIDYSEGFMQAQVRDALLAVSEFVYLSGDFAFRRGASTELTVKTGLSSKSGVTANSIEFGANNVQAFVGVNGPYRTDSNHDGSVDTNDPINPDAVGLVIDDFDFGMTILNTVDSLDGVPKGTTFTALKAHGEDIGFVGFGD